MNSGDLLRDIMIIGGIILLIATVISLSRRKMTEVFSLAWFFLSILLVAGGILLKPTGIRNYVSTVGLILAVFLGTLVIVAAFWVTLMISRLERQNRELAMQLSILQAEQKQLRKEAEEKLP